MAKQTKTPKTHTQVKDLPKKEKTLTKEEQKKVKGGLLPGRVKYPNIVLK